VVGRCNLHLCASSFVRQELESSRNPICTLLPPALDEEQDSHKHGGSFEALVENCIQGNSCADNNAVRIVSGGSFRPSINTRFPDETSSALSRWKNEPSQDSTGILPVKPSSHQPPTMYLASTTIRPIDCLWNKTIRARPRTWSRPRSRFTVQV
jgi:hypothetical protein